MRNHAARDLAMRQDGLKTYWKNKFPLLSEMSAINDEWIVGHIKEVIKKST
ncbi:hypothetical protein [Nitrosomonas communis]|uniref:hypothetical protein n=1 Tax=Nitrosomonas communis TaxID=44574 RepID=UPI0015A71DA1|nr:hypothetical protein [Nitrosomonas communis]